MKYKEFVNDWLENFHKNYVKHQTYIKYRSNLNNYVINSFLGDLEFDKITCNDINDFMFNLTKVIGERTKKPLSSRTINEVFNIIQSSFNYALRMEMIKESPCVRFKKLPTNNISLREKCYSVEEQKAIETYVQDKNNPYHFGIIMCLYTGLRIGELCGLKWSDIDFSEGILIIKREVYISKNSEGKWRLMEDRPKTSTSERIVPLQTFLLKDLQEIRKKSKSEYVISIDGERITPGRFRYQYDRIINSLGLRYITFHGLRHTFAGRAIESGMDIRTLSEILGHSTPGTTINIYGHSMLEHKVKAMRKVKPLVTSPKVKIHS